LRPRRRNVQKKNRSNASLTRVPQPPAPTTRRPCAASDAAAARPSGRWTESTCDAATHPAPWSSVPVSVTTDTSRTGRAARLACAIHPAPRSSVTSSVTRDTSRTERVVRRASVDAETPRHPAHASREGPTRPQTPVCVPATEDPTLQNATLILSNADSITRSGKTRARN